MLAREWDTGEVIHLITLLKKQRLLYDMNDPLYTNTKAREKALGKIAKDLNNIREGTLYCEVKEKVCLLRAQFAAELQSQDQNRKANGESNCEPKLWCFNLLQFLNLSTNTSDDNIENSANSNAQDDGEEFEDFTELKGVEDQSENSIDYSPIKARRKVHRIYPSRRDDHEKYRNRQHNENIDAVTTSGSLNLNKKKNTNKKKKKYERAYAAIQIAKQFANKYSTKQKESKNLMFSNFICDELDDIKHSDILDEVKWDIQEIIRNALKRDREATRRAFEMSQIDKINEEMNNEGMVHTEILYEEFL